MRRRWGRRRKMRKRRELLDTETKRRIWEEGDIGRKELEKGKRLKKTKSRPCNADES